MPDERLTKNQRREQARELARKEREKIQRRDRLMKILIPVIVVVVLLGAGTGVGVAIALQPKPAPVAASGPKNMISDGIVFTGQDGKVVPTTTPGIKKGDDPTPAPTATASGDPVHITTYVDWACPVCQSFEETNFAQIQDMVKAGTAVLEVKPVSIVNRSYTGERYADRINNAAACIANYDPDKFLQVEKAVYDKQPAEGSPGLTDNQIITQVHDAGLDDPKVDACIRGESFKNWVSATTARATSDASLIQPGSQGFGTPTIVVDGTLLSGDAFKASMTDASAFKSFVDQVAALRS